MIVRTTRIKLRAAGNRPLLINGRDIHETAVFLDLEHYIYRKPICIGIFGAAVVEAGELVLTQYFLENRGDLKGLITSAHDYLLEKRAAGYEYLVTFAGQNDLMMLHAMFVKFGIKTDLRQVFDPVDLQSVFKQEFSGIIGLNALEDFCGIRREGPDISGSTIAKTFANVMADPGYIHRIPEDKIDRLLAYNQQDVENLCHILLNWGSLSRERAREYLEAVRLRSIRVKPEPVKEGGDSHEENPS